MIGQTIGHYKIVEKLGEGGMGVVYRAEDSQLEREVAIKTLPEEFTADAERLARFDREAKVLASLNHPNIASIYDLATHGETHFLVLELVEGESLFDRIARGPIPPDEALGLSLQIIEALDAAHTRGIVHRDLKPANVMLMKDGTVKVLDFGLAKAWEQNEASPGMSHSPTLTAQMTRAGIILGTAAYMSPEQARGEEADQRADIWSFGVVLFEMITGRQLFAEPTVSDTLAAVLRANLDLDELPADTPAAVRKALRRCLARDSRQRLHAIADARLDLLEEEEAPSAEAEEAGRRIFGPAMLVGIAVAALAAGIFLGPRLIPSSDTGAGGTGGRPAHVSIPLPPQMWVGETRFLLSPDGSVIAFEGRPRDDSDQDQSIAKLYTRTLGSSEIREVEGSSDGVIQWTFSPDSKWLVLRHPIAVGSSKSRLSKVPVDGSSPPLALGDWSDDWSGFLKLLWLPDGDILYIAEDRPQKMIRIPTDGGPPREAGAVDFGDRDGIFALHPTLASLLPDGNHLLGRYHVSEEESGYEISVALVDLDTGKGRVLLQNGSRAQFSATGHLVFSRGDGLLAVRFDPRQLETAGSPISISTGMRTAQAWTDSYFNLAENGTLLYKPGGLIGGSRGIFLADERFESLEPLSEDRRAFVGGLEVSPDDRRFAVGIANDMGLVDIWVSDVNHPRFSLLVREAGEDCILSVWTPDSARLAYRCRSPRRTTVSIRSADGTGAAEILVAGTPTDFYSPDSFLPDGSTLFMTRAREGEYEIWALPLATGEAGEREASLLIAEARDSSVSPDGKWIAYRSDASGRSEIYMRRLNGDRPEGPEILVSNEGGLSPYWFPQAPDGALELRYFNQRFDLFSVKLVGDTGAGLSESTVVASFSKLRSRARSWHPLRDRRWLIVIDGEDEEEPTELNIVFNWLSELESLIAAR